MSDKPKDDQTADEMFRELGFTKSEGLDGHPCYVNMGEELMIDWVNGYWRSVNPYGVYANLSTKEILACAKLAEELGLCE